MRAFLLILLAAFALSGCSTFEDLFGKESGKRGALPGKREDVFAAESGVKPDANLQAGGIDLGPVIELPDWPQAGGSATRLHGALALSEAPREAWSVSVGSGSSDDGVVVAQPIAVGDRVYTVDSEASVSAIAASNGSVIWRQEVPQPRPDGVISGSGLAFADGRLIVTTSYGHVVALDAATGKVIWQKTVPAPIRSAPFIGEGKVYVIATTNTIYELAFADGTLGWSHTGIQENASFLGMASPLIADDLVVAPYSSGEVFGLRRINGKLAWEENLASTQRGGALPAMADIQGQPVLDGARVYVASHSGRLVALDTRSGRTVWEADISSVQTPWVAGNTIYIVTAKNQMVALSREDGRVRWSVELPRYIDPEDKTETISWAGPVLAGGKLWIVSSEGEIMGVNPADGGRLAGMSVGAPVYLAPIVAGRTLYVLTDRGSLVAFR